MEMEFHFTSHPSKPYKRPLDRPDLFQTSPPSKDVGISTKAVRKRSKLPKTNKNKVVHYTKPSYPLKLENAHATSHAARFGTGAGAVERESGGGGGEKKRKIDVNELKGLLKQVIVETKAKSKKIHEQKEEIGELRRVLKEKEEKLERMMIDGKTEYESQICQPKSEAVEYLKQMLFDQNQIIADLKEELHRKRPKSNLLNDSDLIEHRENSLEEINKLKSELKIVQQQRDDLIETSTVLEEYLYVFREEKEQLLKELQQYKSRAEKNECLNCLSLEEKLVQEKCKNLENDDLVEKIRLKIGLFANGKTSSSSQSPLDNKINTSAEDNNPDLVEVSASELGDFIGQIQFIRQECLAQQEFIKELLCRQGK